MEVDKKDLEEVEAVASFVEKTEIFDKALATESTLSTDEAHPQASEPSIPQVSCDKLVADEAKVKANQLKINKSWIWYFNLRRRWIFFFKF